MKLCPFGLNLRVMMFGQGNFQGNEIFSVFHLLIRETKLHNENFSVLKLNFLVQILFYSEPILMYWQHHENRKKLENFPTG